MPKIPPNRRHGASPSTHELRSGRTYTSGGSLNRQRTAAGRGKRGRGPAPANALGKLPTELLLHVFSHLKPAHLAAKVEPTCKALQRLAQPGYLDAYGARPTHRAVNGPGEYRALGREQHEFQQLLREMSPASGGSDATGPGSVERLLLDDWYLCSQETLDAMSQLCIVALHEDPEAGSSRWHEAMGTALLAQGRHAEALVHYRASDTQDPHLLANRVLTAARFGWTEGFPPLGGKDLERSTVERALLGAAAGGLLSIIRDLDKAGVDLHAFALDHSAGTAAAAHNQTAVLAYLHDRGVDLVGHPAPRVDSPLWEAAKHDSREATEFLLRLGARPDVAAGPDSCSPFVIALRTGNAAIVDLLAQHRPTLAATHTAAGDLTLADALDTLSPDVKCIELIRLLVSNFGADVDAVDTAGRTLAHHAARRGSVAIMKALAALGAPLWTSSWSGETPHDIAIAGRYPALVEWLETRARPITAPAAEAGCGGGESLRSL
jgi:hypothetical protein